MERVQKKIGKQTENILQYRHTDRLSLSQTAYDDFTIFFRFSHNFSCGILFSMPAEFGDAKVWFFFFENSATQ